jgi:hypothetical protein
VVAVKFAVGRVVLPEAPIAIVWFKPPLILYVTVVFGVAVKVMTDELPEQTGLSPETVIFAVGLGNTVRIMLSVATGHVPSAPADIVIVAEPPFIIEDGK